MQVVDRSFGFDVVGHFGKADFAKVVNQAFDAPVFKVIQSRNGMNGGPQGLCVTGEIVAVGVLAFRPWYFWW